MKKAEIQQVFTQSKNYEELSSARNQLIMKHIKQNSSLQTTLPLIQAPKQERIVLISLLVVSLISIGGLLMRLREKKIRSRNKHLI
jgi:hypothetical protein